MNKWKNSFGMKVACFLISLVSIIVLLVTGFVSIFMADNGFYNKQKSEIQQDCFNTYDDIYQVMALTHMEDEEKPYELKMTNFQYAIMEGKDIDKIDISNTKNYLDTNMTNTFPKNGLKDGTVKAASWDIDDNTVLNYQFGIFGYTTHYYNGNYSSFDDEQRSRNITGYYYDIDTGIFYYEIENGNIYVPVKYIDLYINGSDEIYSLSYDRNQQAYYNSELVLYSEPYFTLNDLDGSSYNWMNWSGVQLDDDYIDRNDINFVNENAIGLVTDEKYQHNSQTEITFKDENVGKLSVEELEKLNNTHHYWVVYQLKNPMENYSGVLQNSFLPGDLYQQGNTIINILYQGRYLILIILVITLILWLGSSLLLFIMAGHHNGENQICGGFLTIIPLDLFVAIIFTLELLIMGGCALVCSTGVSVWTITMLGIFSVLGYAICFAFFIDFIIRIKMGKWWRNTVCFKFCAWITRPFRRGMAAARENLSLTFKACIVLGIAAVMELFVIVLTNYEIELEVLMWFVWKVITCGILLSCILQMAKLNKATERMAQGKLDEQVDTKHMIWEFKQHGENLNRIKQGIDTAVVEKMKSERFKTELITNVSHDIKTPLTSIINYVDLLEKEEVDNPKVQEYVEVLTRQSKRLKNLIEDLMEASKASTGNIEMHFEQINLTVLLSQILGEFEDRLVQHNLEIVIQKPDQDICIQADGRHLWRVLDNLLVNICKYAMEGTRVYIDFNLYQDSQYVDIAFKNISRNQLNISGDELLQRFVRGDASRNTEGNGLGLSIAQSLTELMHGTLQITVDGDLFKVSITFPVDRAVEESIDEQNRQQMTIEEGNS